MGMPAARVRLCASRPELASYGFPIREKPKFVYVPPWVRGLLLRLSEQVVVCTSKWVRECMLKKTGAQSLAWLLLVPERTGQGNEARWLRMLFVRGSREICRGLWNGYSNARPWFVWHRGITLAPCGQGWLLFYHTLSVDNLVNSRRFSRIDTVLCSPSVGAVLVRYAIKQLCILGLSPFRGWFILECDWAYSSVRSLTRYPKSQLPFPPALGTVGDF